MKQVFQAVHIGIGLCSPVIYPHGHYRIGHTYQHENGFQYSTLTCIIGANKYIQSRQSVYFYRIEAPEVGNFYFVEFFIH